LSSHRWRVIESGGGNRRYFPSRPETVTRIVTRTSPILRTPTAVIHRTALRDGSRAFPIASDVRVSRTTEEVWPPPPSATRQFSWNPKAEIPEFEIPIYEHTENSKRPSNLTFSYNTQKKYCIAICHRAIIFPDISCHLKTSGTNIETDDTLLSNPFCINEGGGVRTSQR